MGGMGTCCSHKGAQTHRQIWPEKKKHLFFFWKAQSGSTTQKTSGSLTDQQCKWVWNNFTRLSVILLTYCGRYFGLMLARALCNLFGPLCSSFLCFSSGRRSSWRRRWSLSSPGWLTLKTPWAASSTSWRMSTNVWHGGSSCPYDVTYPPSFDYDK